RGGDRLGPPPNDGREQSRRSALWVLVALGILAVLTLVVMLGFSSGGGHHNDSVQSPPVSAVPSEPASTAALPTSPAARGTTPTGRTPRQKPPAPARTGPCPSPAPCAVPGDHARLVAAVNVFRAAHQQPAVPGTVSPQAQQSA